MATLTDYKLPSTTRRDDGTTVALMRVYEGDITTEDELDPRERDGSTIQVERYRRSAVLRGWSAPKALTMF